MSKVFTESEIIKILEHLIGEIEPIADSHIDEERLYNLELWCAVADYMMARIYEVSTNNDLKIYGSANNIIETAKKKLDYILSDIVLVKVMKDNAIDNIKADLDEAKESFSDCKNETDKSFQQGRIYADKFALTQIERLIGETK